MAQLHRTALIAVSIVALLSPVSAQQHVTDGDISRLQDYVYLAERDVARLRATDAPQAAQIQGELAELRDEVAYLRIKLRKEGAVPRAEYIEVRDKLQDLRTRTEQAASASAATRAVETPTSAAPEPIRASRPSTRTSATIEIPVGTEIDVRMSQSLNSGTAKVEDRFEGTTVEDLTVDGRTAIPAGSVLRGIVSAVEPGTRTNRMARMTVSFDRITVNGRTLPLRATVTEAIEGEGLGGEKTRAGVGAGIGGILGGLLGGFKGAIAGILIGAGGTIAATEGKEVELAQGSVLRVRIDSPLEIDNPAGPVNR